MEAGGPEVIETAGALNVSYRGRLLYPERGPLAFAARLAAAAELGPERLYLLPSPLLWHGVPELLDRIEEGSALLCLEADPELAKLALERMPKSLRDERRLLFLPTADPEAALAASRKLGLFRRVILLRLSGGEALHREAYGRVASFLQADFAAGWRSKSTLLSMGRLWARNIFRNVAALPRLPLAPPPSFTGALAVCGAGPSLEAGLPFLARESARGRLAVLACDTALGTLLAAGIRPELVVCLEGQAHNLPDFIPGALSGIALLGDLSSHPASFGIMDGPVSLSCVDITPSPFLSRMRSMLAAGGIPLLPCPPLGSVGVHALHLGRVLSPGPIFALGLDFSFEAGKTHARASPSLLAEERRLDRLHPWPNQAAAAWREGVRPAGPFAGPGLFTDPVLSSYAALLADEAARPGPRVYDLRGRGLDLGLARLDFSEASRLLGRDGAMDGAMDGGLPAGGDMNKPIGSLPDGLAREALASAIIGEELGRLEAIADAMKGRRTMSGEAFITLVSESDYLLWPLPDGERLPSLAQDLLNRLLVEVEYWLWKLKEIGAVLEENASGRG